MKARTFQGWGALAAIVAGAVASAACGGKLAPVDEDAGAGGASTGPTTTGTDEPPDPPVPTSTSTVPPKPPEPFVEAFQDRLSVPQLVFNGGPMLMKPDVVTVTWNGDVNASIYEGLGDAIGASSYWKTIVSEYGVGPATGGKHVHLDMTTTSMTIDDLDALVAGAVQDPATSGWPAHATDTLYVLYIPTALKVTYDGFTDLCDYEGGHHTSTFTDDGVEIPYAVVMSCFFSGVGTDLAGVELAATHEIAEAALDPMMSSPGWLGLDPEHLAWDLMQGFQDENADLCEFFFEAMIDPMDSGFPWTAQRMWSNLSAASGHHPCVPVPLGETYFNVTPLTPLDTVTANVDWILGTNVGTQASKGVHLTGTTPSSITLGLFSDAPIGAWDLEAYETEAGMPFSGTELFPPASQPSIAVSLDRSSGTNGDEVTLTVRALSPTSVQDASINAAVVLVKSSVSNGATGGFGVGAVRYFPILVSQ